ncbi:hypothetical protein predicted by Glimmer/Critica [Sorangium cellulosum So ce56]|uniref:Uncharacterized protein n=1 Tax=Sorangium cellulosum (strain So ce56) TaxID=448385 RepID=A9FTK5_SORC5|nr:hypothetical protein predicted by Glimmer/Critica [Sorangium cellulosum So ce56]
MVGDAMTGPAPAPPADDAEVEGERKELQAFGQLRAPRPTPPGTRRGRRRGATGNGCSSTGSTASSERSPHGAQDLQRLGVVRRGLQNKNGSPGAVPARPERMYVPSILRQRSFGRDTAETMNHRGGTAKGGCSLAFHGRSW